MRGPLPAGTAPSGLRQRRWSFGQARSATFVDFPAPHYPIGKPASKPTWISNAQAVDRLRGLTRWTVIRCPALEDRSFDCGPAAHAWLPCPIIDPQVFCIFTGGTVCVDKIA